MNSSGLLTLSAGLLAFAAPAPAAPATPVKPNIVFILGDDIGFGDLGCYGQTKIRTPHLDRLAAEGLRFTHLYSGNAVCAPSRCVLLTGKHPGHAFIRNNREIEPEGQYPIPENTVTLAKLLQQQGYVTGGFGTWGLGGPGSSGEPTRQGFDEFYGYLCQRQAHNHFPTHLWRNGRKVLLNNPDFPADQKFPAGADPHDPKNYLRYLGNEYAPDLMAAQARRFLAENKDRPFFLYFPTTVAHLALQVPEDSLKEYEGKFPETPYDGRDRYLPHRTPHAAYAAMITRMDREVGRLIDLIKAYGLDENTIFIFTVDNGPLYENHGGTDTDFFRSAGSLRGRKGSLYEAGVRVPGLVRWKGRIAPGGVTHHVAGFEDWLPTLLELIGARDAVPAGLDGISFAPVLRGESQPERPFLYREFTGYGGYQFVRQDGWKAIRQNLAPLDPRAPAVSVPPELYNLKDDPNETTNLASRHPDILARLEQIMREQHTPSAEFPLPAIDHRALR
ncbi:MAG: arylsulfatase [Pedosphaera parvula]|nr:arylsulfatase [Pedosphaera parvula]